MMYAALMTPPVVYLTTFLFSLAGGIVPFLSVEAYLVSLSALSPQTALVPTAVAAAGGQMVAKVLLYLTGRGLLKLPARGRGQRMREVATRLARLRGRATALLFVSAATGIPPFYAMSLAAGFTRFPLGRFVAVGCVGRLMRFTAVYWLPRLVT